jgi:hypothetical protein
MKKLIFPQALLFLCLLVVTTSGAYSNTTEDEYYDDDDLVNEKNNYYYEEESQENPPIFDGPQEEDEHWVPEDEWHRYFPPKRSDGRPIPATPEGVKEWERIAQEAKDRYKELEEMFHFSQDKKPRPYPFCVDGKLPKRVNEREDDHNLENFVPFFALSQPRNGLPVVADKYGKTSIVHIEDGIDAGPYITSVIYLILL